MAPPERRIRDGEASVKLRSPLNSALFDVITIGIYGFYWFYVTNRDLAELGRSRGTTELGENPMNSFLAAMPGVFILVPFIISGYNTAERVRAAQRISGVGEKLSSAAAIVAMVLFFPIAIFYVQKHLNEVWELETG